MITSLIHCLFCSALTCSNSVLILFWHVLILFWHVLILFWHVLILFYYAYIEAYNEVNLEQAKCDVISAPRIHAQFTGVRDTGLTDGKKFTVNVSVFLK